MKKKQGTIPMIKSKETRNNTGMASETDGQLHVSILIQTEILATILQDLIPTLADETLSNEYHPK